MNIKKILTFAGIALVLFLVFTAPDQAAGAVNGILSRLRDAAQAIITFVRSLFV